MNYSNFSFLILLYNRLENLTCLYLIDRKPLYNNLSWSYRRSKQKVIFYCEIMREIMVVYKM